MSDPYIVFVSGHYPPTTYYPTVTRKTFERYTQMHGYGFYYDDSLSVNTNATL